MDCVPGAGSLDGNHRAGDCLVVSGCGVGGDGAASLANVLECTGLSIWLRTFRPGDGQDRRAVCIFSEVQLVCLWQWFGDCPFSAWRGCARASLAERESIS